MKRPHGRGMLDFLLVVLIFGVLAATLLGRLIDIDRTAERAAVDLAIRNMRVGLQLAIGERIVQGREDSMGELLDVNPLSFLTSQPAHEAVNGDMVEPGNWRFESADRTLFYWPRQPEAFGGRTELRWRIAAQRAGGQRIAGIRLQSTTD